MLVEDEVVIFLSTDNAEKSREFYQDILGLELLADEPFALVFSIDNKTLRIAKTSDFSAAGHTVLGWKVRNIDEKVSSLSARGVRFTLFDGMAQEENGVWHSPSGAKVAWFTDPVGNVLSLTQI